MSHLPSVSKISSTYFLSDQDDRTSAVHPNTSFFIWASNYSVKLDKPANGR
jgi:hypothetical protein